MKVRRITAIVLLLVITLTAQAQQLAFPDAQGWGRFATGGRTGSVYHVTNLNDSGTGSLRDAISQANRIIVFDVAGVINIKSRLVFKNNLYVAGQTAPGEGITVYGDGVSFSGASNIIVRYMRFRMGHKGSGGKDCAGIANGQNMIFDHCSFAWGLDETFSINPDGKGATPEYITLQNSIVGQGLMTHSAGGLLQTDHISIVGNFLCDNNTRNFKIKGINQYANNIVYNWGNGAYIMGGDSEGKSYVNIQSNLFINGPAKGGAAFTGGNADFHCYGVDNWQDRNMDGVFDPQEVTDYNAATRESSPYDYPELDLNPGRTLLDTNLPTVGASLPYRDPVDYYMADEVMSYGLSGALISNEETLVYGAPSTWSVYAGSKKQDTDGDGMPDAWEQANGTNPSVNDAMTIAANGYANIENYINSITIDDRDLFLRTPVALTMQSSTTTTLTLSWRDYTYGEDGFTVELQKDGNYVEVGRTSGNATSFTVTGLESGKLYNVRVRAFAGSLFSAYTPTVEMATRPVEAGVVDIDSYQPDYTWTEGALSKVDADGKQVLLAPPTTATLTLTESVSPATIVYKQPYELTISGTGLISGTGSVNKAGSGTLTLTTANTYTGATVLHDGTLAFNSLKDGGTASAIGAGMAFAQNWLFDGGTYRYTGGNTSTNRSLKLTNTTTFDIASATVTMTGTAEGTDNACDFVLDGGGTLTVGTTDFFAYPGATVLRGSTLYLSATEIAKAGIGQSSKLVFAGGRLQTKGETSNYETYNFPIEVIEGTTSQFSPFRNCYLESRVTGAGNLQLDIPYVREYIKGDWSAFTGRLIGNGLSSEKGGSLMLLEGNPHLENCVVELTGNARLTSWTTNASTEIGGLAGSAGTYLSGSSKQTDGFKCTWIVGGAGSDETFAGQINDWSAGGSGHTGTVSIVKTGVGLWRLTGANSFSGTTTVKEGMLIVNGNNSGTGAVTVEADATLAGEGAIAGSVTVKGMLHAGDTQVSGKGLTLNSTLNINAGAVVNVPLNQTRCNTITLKGRATLTSGAVLQLSDGVITEPLYDGTAYQIFNLQGGTVTGAFAAIWPERPGEGQSWDTSELYSKGILKVTGGDVAPDPDPQPEVQPNGWFDRTVSYRIQSVHSRITGTKPYFQAADANGEDGQALLLTTNAAQAANVYIAVGDEEKGLYYLYDLTGERFINPSADDNYGTPWTYSTTPVAISVIADGQNYVFSNGGSAEGNIYANAVRPSGSTWAGTSYVSVNNYRNFADEGNHWAVTEVGTIESQGLAGKLPTVPTGIAAPRQDSGRAERIYGLDGTLRPSIRHGLNIVRRADGTVKKIYL